MEYPADIMHANTDKYIQLAAGPGLRDTLPPGVVRSKSGDMLSNGARYYLDVGSKVEYATPEDTSLWGTVAAEHAGEIIVANGLKRYIAARDDIRRCILEKRVYGDNGDTWGYHINLSADARRIPPQNAEAFPATMHLLALHLATYDLYAGAGTIYKDGEGEVKFSLAQKALGLGCDFRNGTNSHPLGKPLINLRNEPHAPAEDLRRIHITSSDPNISPWATWMKLGTNSLILRAIEQRRANNEVMRLKRQTSYVDIGRLTATDLTFSKKVELANDDWRTPLEIQKALFDIASKTYYTDQEAEVLDEWERALSDFEKDPMLLRDRSDAIAKYDLMQKRMEIKGVALDDDGMRVIDHDAGTLLFINKDHVPTEKHPETPTPMSVKLRQGRWENWMTSDEELAKRVTTPPSTTRAHQRGRAIKTGNVRMASWTKYSLWNGTKEKTIDIAHPLIFDSENIDSDPEDDLLAS
jgi:proteasome accessory factor A